MKTAREAALISLCRSEKYNKYANLELDAAIRKYNLAGAERSLFTILVYGVIERRITLDYFIDHFSNIPPDTLDPYVMNLIRIGAYQILYLDRIPESAACNESVKLAKQYANPGAANYVNAMLRKFCREKKTLCYPDRTADLCGYLSVRYSFPRWLCEMWLSQYGEERLENILKSLNRHPGVTLRVNTLKTTREDLLHDLAEAGLHAKAAPLSACGILLESGTSLTDLYLFTEGRFFVQDEASQLCTDFLDVRPGHTLIDACACPGGKSFSCAMHMKNEGRIIACDNHRNKLPLIEEGATRLGIRIIETRCRNSSIFDPELERTADRVLCDVPCSGLGVIAKKPDLRFKEPDDIATLPETQYNILKNCSSYVKPGGLLMYSTCTLRASENEEVIRRFLIDFGDSFTLCSHGTRTFMPDTDDTDGFFTALIHRKS